MMGFGYVLDPEGHIAHRFKSDPMMQAATLPHRDAAKVATDLVSTTVGVKRDSLPPPNCDEVAGVSILNKYIDPRSGESTTRLTNIDLSEPSIDLFQLPPEYKIVADTEPVTIHHQP